MTHHAIAPWRSASGELLGVILTKHVPHEDIPNLGWPLVDAAEEVVDAANGEDRE